MALGRKRGTTSTDAVAAPQKARWQGLENAFTKMVMTLGIVGIGTALGAILGTQDIDAWIVGLVVSVLSVILAALLWSRYRD
jgi:protein-S-isoprenylcysteine O-methyltransferase Ste14